MTKGPDGEWERITEIKEFPPLTEQPETVETTLLPDKEMTFTMTIKPTKNMRCKSRKRYIKLLMSRGFPRNLANLMAKDFREMHQAWCVPFSYQTMWSHNYWTLI